MGKELDMGVGGGVGGVGGVGGDVVGGVVGVVGVAGLTARERDILEAQKHATVRVVYAERPEAVGGVKPLNGVNGLEQPNAYSSDTAAVGVDGPTVNPYYSPRVPRKRSGLHGRSKAVVTWQREREAAGFEGGRLKGKIYKSARGKRRVRFLQEVAKTGDVGEAYAQVYGKDGGMSKAVAKVRGQGLLKTVPEAASYASMLLDRQGLTKKKLVERFVEKLDKRDKQELDALKLGFQLHGLVGAKEAERPNQSVTVNYNLGGAELESVLKKLDGVTKGLGLKNYPKGHIPDAEVVGDGR